METSVEIMLAEATGSSTPGHNIDALGLSQLSVPAGHPALPVRFLLVVRGTPDLTLDVVGTNGYASTLRFPLSSQHLPPGEHVQMLVDGEVHLPTTTSQDFRFTVSGASSPRSVDLAVRVHTEMETPRWLLSWRAHLLTQVRSLATEVVLGSPTRDVEELTSLLGARVRSERSLNIDEETLRAEILKLV